MAEELIIIKKDTVVGIKETKIKTYALAIKDIEKKYGAFKPTDVVREAEKKNNPLHDYFEWDNKIAGHKFRLLQANILIRAIYIKTGQKKTSMFYSIESSPQKTVYISKESAFTNADLYKRLLKDGYNSCLSLKERYEKITELKPIFDAIENVGKNLKNEGKI